MAAWGSRCSDSRIVHRALLEYVHAMCTPCVHAIMHATCACRVHAVCMPCARHVDAMRMPCASNVHTLCTPCAYQVLSETAWTFVNGDAYIVEPGAPGPELVMLQHGDVLRFGVSCLSSTCDCST